MAKNLYNRAYLFKKFSISDIINRTKGGEAGVPARALCVPEKITLSVIAVRCQLSRKGELFAFYGKHKESSPFRGSWMRTK